MKNIALTVLVFLFLAPGLHSQNKKEKIKVYKIWVTKMDGSKEKGFFYKADEMGITISKTNSLDESNLLLVKAEKISLVKLRRKGTVAKSAGIGFLSGAAVGTAMGFAAGDGDGIRCTQGSDGIICRGSNATAGEKAVVGAIGLGIIGTGIGAIVGTGKKKILIDGDQETYLIHLNSLINYTLRQN